MIPPIPPLMFSAWAAAFLLWVLTHRGPPKGPSLQAVEEQLELPLVFASPGVPGWEVTR